MQCSSAGIGPGLCMHYQVYAEQESHSRPDWTGRGQNGLVRVLCLCAILFAPGILFKRKRGEICIGARLPFPARCLVQVGLDSAYLRTQYMKQASCGLQARVGPARLGLAFAAPHRHIPRGNSASVPLSFVISTIALRIIASPRRQHHHLL